MSTPLQDLNATFIASGFLVPGASIPIPMNFPASTQGIGAWQRKFWFFVEPTWNQTTSFPQSVQIESVRVEILDVATYRAWITVRNPAPTTVVFGPTGKPVQKVGCSFDLWALGCWAPS